MDIIDNINKTLADDLRETLRQGSRVSIAASCFSIYAYQALREELEQVDELRFIFTSPTFTKERPDKAQREFYIPQLKRERSLTSGEFEIRLRNELTQRSIARECAAWIRRKAHFKSNQTKEQMSGFGVVDNLAYTPLKGFTMVDLGFDRGDNAYTMISKLEAPQSKQFLQLFDQLWCDDARMQEVTEEVIESISTVYRENAPEYIYMITLYNIFHEFLKDLSEDVLPNEANGFKESKIWSMLYNFQRDAALAIINKLEQYNGCVLADSVGLGKTFTALSVIKYYELRNKDVLVLCPRKLSENWNDYRKNYKNNPLAADRLRYEVLFHTDLGRAKGMSNDVDLEKINWGNFDLVVIDESHNFRNGGSITLDEDGNPKENRYLRLMNEVIRKGVQTKVLMLSATPVNNHFYDLKCQLELAYAGDYRHFDTLLDTESSINDIFRDAQKVYNRWAKLSDEHRTTEALLSELSFDFFKVLDSVTIARSRRHIVQYYDTTEIGSFPNRLPVKSRRPLLTDLDDAITYDEIYKLLDNLNLTIYTPSAFIYPSKQGNYQIKGRRGRSTGGLSISGRESGLRRLMSINLMKRLESSVHSFRLTLERVQRLIESTLDKIHEAQNGRMASVNEYQLTDELDPDDAGDILIGGDRYAISLADIDCLSWQRSLKEDLVSLKKLLNKIQDIKPEHDSKLLQLKEDLRDKWVNPINEGNKKVIIFTAFADTAKYIYATLAPDIKEQWGLNTVLITGSDDPRSTLQGVEQGLTFNKALTLFSPRSKGRDAIYPDTSEEIDVLIATDCISEGQNLQDCDYLINYDIHWNPVRIIQRFGRIDRIGSQNKDIQLVNYWPNVTLDEYINLKARVENRMKAMTLAATGDDDLLSKEEKGDLAYRRKQLERLQDEVVDLEEMDTGFSIMDLGLNEFRLDLIAYNKEHPNLDVTPLGLSGVVPSSDLLPPGVIYVLKNCNEEINIDRKNQLHPFYMIYLSREGQVICNHLSPKRLLDLMRLACKGVKEPNKKVCQLFNQETQDGQKMAGYSDLLQKAVECIISVKEDSDINSLFSEGATTALQNKINGLDDFELITFLVIK